MTRPHISSGDVAGANVAHPVAAHPTRSLIARYGFALMSIAIGTGLTSLIWGYIKPQVSPLFFLGVMVSAWYGGLGPGLLATALSSFLCIYLFSEPVFSLVVDAADFLRVAVFLGVAVTVSALADARRRAEGELRLAHEGLERRVAERTRELAELNRALMREVNERQRTQVELVEHQSRLQQLASEVVLAEQRERRRLAERLHDDIGQLLALSQIRIGELHGVCDSAVRANSLGAVESLLEEAIARTRSITCELSPPVLYELGLDAAIQWLAEGFREQTGFRTAVHYEGDSVELPEQTRVTLFHVTRELLANVAKHAKAQELSILLRRQGDQVCVAVEDDGEGFDPLAIASRERSTSFGLFSISERLRHHGGSLQIHSRPGAGARVCASLPLPDAKGAGE